MIPNDPAAGRQRPPPTLETYDIRIARDGTWFHNGEPIRRLELARLFSTVLRRDEDGGYWLVTPAERGRIQVEDVPFVAVAVTAEGEGRDQILTLRTNLDHEVPLDAEHPLRVDADEETGEPKPYVTVRPGLEARLARTVFYELVDRAEERPATDGRVELGVWSRGRFFPLGQLEET